MTSDPASGHSGGVGGPVLLQVVPEARRAQVGPDAPPPMRLMAAKALLPMEPAELAPVLAYLGSSGDDKLRAAAGQTARELPDALLEGPLSSAATHPQVLDWFARLFVDVPKRAERLILNGAVADETIAHLTKSLRDATLLDLIGANQIRILRSPAIIEALYFNPETRMSTISRAIETAVRNGVRLTHIPGFKEIEESILGTAPKGDEAEEVDVTDEDAPEPEAAPGVDDEVFQTVLRADLSPEGAEEAVKKALGVALHNVIADMNVAQKVRMAMLGSEAARRLLVRDTKRVVAMSVLRSPRLTPREITNFAQARAVNEDVIREIARNREWTKYYPTMLALVTNPKCPPQQAMTFVKMLTPRDLKSLSRDKEVPGFIARTAKSLVEAREKRGR
ncbi:MAG: hypothetical protein AMXMBFR64_09180 [Myxococcales bacterium]